MKFLSATTPSSLREKRKNKCEEGLSRREIRANVYSNVENIFRSDEQLNKHIS